MLFWYLKCIELYISNHFADFTNVVKLSFASSKCMTHNRRKLANIFSFENWHESKKWNDIKLSLLVAFREQSASRGASRAASRTSSRSRLNEPPPSLLGSSNIVQPQPQGQTATAFKPEMVRWVCWTGRSVLLMWWHLTWLTMVFVWITRTARFEPT